MIGIIANPQSGKDIRRIVAEGSTTANHEKINTLRRIVQGIAALGPCAVRFMPDRADLVGRALDSLQVDLDVAPLDLPITGMADDTTTAAHMLADGGSTCIVVLGGDGTCRAVTKGAGSVPILPISTGTNNAFPQTVEGTLAGLAAACVERSVAGEAIIQAPCLRILREGEPVDLALVDVVSYAGGTGARAVWQVDRVRQLITTRWTPGTIGLSAIAGYAGLEPPTPDVALALTLGDYGEQSRHGALPEQDRQRTILAPIAPGLVQPATIGKHRWLAHGEMVRAAPVPCVLALDGERELDVRRGMLIDIQFDQHGPFVVDVQWALELGVAGGLFTTKARRKHDD
jgi:hypothetical protein